MIDIPHLPPIRFAYDIKEVVSEKSIIVSCKFDEIPTLAQLIEAAAQASAGFSDKQKQRGFLIQVRDVALLQTNSDKDLFVKLNNIVNIANMAQFEFAFYRDVKCNTDQVAVGSFSIFKQ